MCSSEATGRCTSMMRSPRAAPTRAPRAAARSRHGAMATHSSSNARSPRVPRCTWPGTDMTAAPAAPLTGPPTDAAFSLTDHHGRPVTDADYRGRFMSIYFGYTHCRALRPRALARLPAALAALGDREERVAPLYITV